ncbi:DUF192 domain-containing protein [Parasphingorhabdus sp.]|uniref:DUF192 domain-containing protein n=1 Tax=Parasphingorhabdus sp. TaxID=2709688 RepID=UPI003A9455A5
MNNIPKAIALSLLLLSVSSLPGCYTRTSEPTANNQQDILPLSEAGLKQVPLSVRTSNATHDFIVEVAENAAQQARGLMFRTQLAADKGMIFPFPEDRLASFWMKNTVIPLDIIFVRRDGTIESIAANTIPYSLASVESNEPVAAVLEIAAGRAAELGIEPGDSVIWAR